MKRMLILVALIAGLVMAAGCGNLVKPQRTAPPDLTVLAGQTSSAGATIEKSAKAAQEKVETARKTVSSVGKDVKAQADTVRAASPAAAPVADRLDANVAKLQDDVVPDLDDAGKYLDDIRRETPVVSQAATDLMTAQTQVLALAKERDTALDAKAKAAAEVQQAQADLKAERASAVRNLMLRLVVLGMLLAVAGIPVFIWLSRPAGIVMVAGGLVVAGLASAVQQYLPYIQAGAVALLAAGLAYVIYAAVRHKDWSALWQQGFAETVNAVERIKQKLTPDQLTAIFGKNGQIDQWVSDIQSRLYHLVKGDQSPGSSAQEK